ncbi:MAG: 23S rRNA (adenine(1618)-N(6))-methyltransferase RlmF [Marinilabiliales bacterium]|nr:MAG: 23S rRNA (adenine(1618)-N(6))-methyltransferase RlmF [Marinilabiliales bacterium]
MASNKKPKEKSRLHPRNKNRENYDLKAMCESFPALMEFVKPNKYGVNSVDFASPKAVRALNTALLKHYYGIAFWDFPEQNLCPPIPGRADYIHHIADLLQGSNYGIMPHGDKIICLDIGTGASCIYPIIGVVEYNWNFIATDVDLKAIDSAEAIILENKNLHGKVDCRLQKEPKDVFYGILRKEDKVDMTICNPPFHASAEEALKGTQRKVKNLSGEKKARPELNFSGVSNELICDGGEHRFIHNMIRESRNFGKNCYWFSTLVSKQSNLKGIYKSLEKNQAQQVKTIPMGTGNKSTRIVAWSFLTAEEQKLWRESRWV